MEKDLKHIAFNLNKLIGKLIEDTPPHRRPLRSNDLEERQEIKKIYKGLGYQHFTPLLKDIIAEGCADILTHLKERKELESGWTLWYFDLGKRHIKSEILKETSKSYNFKINLKYVDSKFFTEKEQTFLKEFKPKLEDLVNEKREPNSDAQTNFRKVIQDLIDKATVKSRPESYYERVIVKYYVYTLIVN